MRKKWNFKGGGHLWRRLKTEKVLKYSLALFILQLLNLGNIYYQINTNISRNIQCCFWFRFRLQSCLGFISFRFGSIHFVSSRFRLAFYWCPYIYFTDIKIRVNCFLVFTQNVSWMEKWPRVTRIHDLSQEARGPHRSPEQQFPPIVKLG